MYLTVVEQSQCRDLALVTGSTPLKMQPYLLEGSDGAGKLHPSCIRAGCWLEMFG